MKILVFNEDTIQKIIPTENRVVISIQDNSCNFVPLPINNFRLGYLGLKFSDVDDIYVHNFNEWCQEAKIKPFTELYAILILNFIKDYKNKVNLILVNCCAGISRSSAIAGALSKILNGEDEYYFKHYLPNRYVYRIILNTYYTIREK